MEKSRNSLNQSLDWIKRQKRNNKKKPKENIMKTNKSYKTLSFWIWINR